MNPAPEASGLLKDAADKRVSARTRAAQDPAAPPEVVTRLAADPSPGVRRAVAARHDLPPAVSRDLATDKNTKVRETLAANPATIDDVLLHLVGDPHPYVRWEVAYNPAAGAEAQRAMADSTDNDLRRLLTFRHDLTPEVTAKLIHDPAVEVRANLAFETRDPATLAALITDLAPRVRAGVAFNTLTTLDQRRLLARDRHADVRSALVRTVALDEADLQRLVHDRSSQVRWWMATAKVTPAHIRQQLLNDPDETVRSQAEIPPSYCTSTTSASSAPGPGRPPPTRTTTPNSTGSTR
ncbi:hypothetical protein Areg01_76410 [Actinoplanes regularis]|nr:hypothetical protein Areg01_76410 [Actinoplanes regularis]